MTPRVGMLITFQDEFNHPGYIINRVTPGRIHYASLYTGDGFSIRFDQFDKTSDLRIISDILCEEQSGV